MAQFDLFLTEGAGSAGRNLVELASQPSAFFVLPCGRRKGDVPAPARDLYTSPRFRALRRIAEECGAPYVIASAKFGLVEPNEVLAPYDEDLNQWPSKARQKWGRDILGALQIHGGSPIVLFADAYASAIVEARAKEDGSFPMHFPLLDRSASEAEEWIQQAGAVSARIRDLRALYRHIEGARAAGETFLLGDLGARALPERGVYVFLDPTEPSPWSAGPRIVRIGTHGVSKGSKSSLRNRLRNHLGPTHGAGSHRGSIFRLHVGRAMLEAGGQGNSVDSWGVGQQAPKPIPDAEIVHERQVTDYLRRLEVFVFDIDDAPSRTSLGHASDPQVPSVLL